MTGHLDVAPVESSRRPRMSTSLVVGLVAFAVTAVVIAAVVAFVIADSHQTPIRTLTPSTPTPYPIGVLDTSDPSGVGPPGPNALAGFHETYVQNFTGDTVPAGWNVFTGVPAGDPGGHFGAKHVVVADGMLELNTWKDPQYNDTWVTGGLCQCEVPKVFGAYFVRSKVTGPGPNEVELLWPANNSWPPEIDFNETGGHDTSTSSTIHWSAINQIEQRHVTINMTQWHTWGVIWTAQRVIYTVDGQEWGEISSPGEITHKPMTLDFEQRALCSLHRQCPTKPVSMDIDWVAEYSPNAPAS